MPHKLHANKHYFDTCCQLVMYISYYIIVTYKYYLLYSNLQYLLFVDTIFTGVQKKYPMKFTDLVIRLGGFHIAENFMGAIGCLMKNSGIEDILVESGVSQRGTANKIIGGKDYYKMIRYHSLVSEAMLGLMWASFECYCTNEGQIESTNNLNDHIAELSEAQADHNTDKARELINNVKEQLTTLQVLWDNFTDQAGLTAKFWMMYIDMCQIIKRYVHAERSGNWHQHLQEVQNMMPYIVSTGHSKYAVCLPIYLKAMRDLPKHTRIFIRHSCKDISLCIALLEYSMEFGQILHLSRHSIKMEKLHSLVV